jgi:hypothetical protein
VHTPSAPQPDKPLPLVSREYVKEQADLHYKENGRVMNDEELHELITQAMELHIAKPTSWQEMAMVESEKKRIRGKAAPEAVSASKETAKEAAYRRIPKLDKFGRAYATGKRKTSVARVWVSPGTGKVIVNKMMMVSYLLHIGFPALHAAATLI